jgi:mycothiol synthase
MPEPDLKAIKIVPFESVHIPTFTRWFRALPGNKAWTEAWVRFKTLDDDTYDPELMVGFLIGNVANEVGWIRTFVVHPERRREGLGTLLFDTIEQRLQARDVTEVNVGWALPRYLLPGIDIAYTPAICFLDHRGYETTREARVNMDVVLTGRDLATADDEKRLEAQGFTVRRAVPEDRDEIEALCHAEGYSGWALETGLALEMPRVPVFIAARAGKIRAFATHSVCGPIHFGPMLTAADLRGLGIGSVLLKLCLRDWQRDGIERCEITWAGPLTFYARSVGAKMGRAFWTFHRSL